jgi:hypothetical protein
VSGLFPERNSRHPRPVPPSGLRVAALSPFASPRQSTRDLLLVERAKSALTDRLDPNFPPSTIQWWNPPGFQIIARLL